MAGQSGSPLINLPGVAPSGLGDWQMQIGSVLMGAGTSYFIIERDMGSADIRAKDKEKPQDDGDWQGVDTYSSRNIILKVQIRGTSVADAEAKYHALELAWYNDSAVAYYSLWWKYPSVAPQRSIGRPRRFVADRSRLLGGRITVLMEFYSPFPSFFSANSTVTATTRVVTGGGNSYAPTLTYPRQYTVTVSGGASVVAANAGAYPAWAALTFTGGVCDHPRLENQTTGAFIGFDTSLISTDTLVVDMRLRTASLNGRAIRHLLTAGSTWWELVGTTTMRYNPSTYDAGSHCDITWASATLG